MNGFIGDEGLGRTAYESLLELATQEGINASGKDEIYGCIFGRDSAITILKILKVLEKDVLPSHIERDTLLSISRRALLRLTELQGREVNIESGEEPGKFIHEYRTDKYDHLVKATAPWYLYPDNIFRNYDSIDSTPLALIAMHRYFSLTQDGEFLLSVLPAVEKGLNWIITYGDRDKDYLVEYEFSKERKYHGLWVQSWTDSHESLMRADGTMPLYPIAPVEVQGYTWLALKLWADFYNDPTKTFSHSQKFAQQLNSFADHMKENFNKVFLHREIASDLYFPVQALDGEKNQIKTLTGNSLLLLWATYKKGGAHESILDDAYVTQMVERSFMSDLFDEDAGIRTMSMLSPTYNPREDSYHNGSFWPKLNGMAYEGLKNWKFDTQAQALYAASLKPIQYFKSPIELYVKTETGSYKEFCGPTGQVSCRTQAWSAAVLLDFLTD